MRLMTVIKLKLKAIELKIRRNILLNLFPLVWRIFLLLGVKAYLHFWTYMFYIFVSQNGKQMVQEGALTALASVADSSQVLAF